jgi:peptide/nickel transport system permease protein
MARYVLLRIGSGVILFFAITLFVFIAFFALPRNTSRAAQRTPTEYRIHGSISGAYARYVWRFVRYGDLGYSYQNREAVTSRLFRAAPVTLSLILGGMVVWMLIAIPLGLLAAMRPRSLLDRLSTVFVLIGLSCHPVWLGLMLSYLFGHALHVLPADGYCSINNLSTGCEGLWQWTYHLVLPWFTFGVINAALFTMMIRALMLEELSAEYVRSARAKGAGQFRVVRHHLLRNIMLPLVTLIGLNAGTALAGVIFVESAFDLPGLGGLLRQATLRSDLPLTAGSVIFLALTIMLLNLVVDLTYVALDPRVKLSAHAAREAV